jgi:RHS repeat-associated protein
MIKGLNNLLVGVVLVLFLLSLPVMAESNAFCDIEGILTGVNTDPENPGVYLVDNNLSTFWAFKPGVEEVWAEISLEEKTLIQALEITGFLSPEVELKIEYYQEGYWLPFLAPTVKGLNGETLLDLSYDRVVTERLRLLVSGNGLSGSYLNELRVLGIEAAEYYHKIKATEIIASGNTDPVYSAEFLNDGNTYTLWKTEKSQKDWQDRKFDEVLEELEGVEIYQNNNGKGNKKGNGNNQQTSAEVELNLGKIYNLDKMKLFLTDHLRGSIELQYYRDDDWHYLGSIDGLPSGNKPGWFSLELKEQNIATDRVRLTVTGYGGELGGISEVEFWGTGSYPGETPKLIGIQEPRQLNQEVNCQFELAAKELREYTLELTVKEISNQVLAVELNGNPLNLEPAFNLRGYTFYQKKIARDYFQEGKNYLKVLPAADNLTLVNCRLSGKVSSHQTPLLGDGCLFGLFNDSGEITVNLASEELSLPSFPAFLEAPDIPGNGSRKIEDWSGPTIINQDVSYDNLTVNTELELDTSQGDVSLIVKNLQLGSNGSISITGPGKAYLFIENDLNLSNGSRINSSGKDQLLELYHNGNTVYLQGGSGGKGQYKLSGYIYTEAEEVFIQNGASFKGKLYARCGNITIRGGITVSDLIYTQTGNITITGGARVTGRIISGGNRVEVSGGSSFDGSPSGGGLLAPEADIHIDQGAVIKGDIIANPARVQIGNINHRQSCYRIIETRNLEKKYIEEVTIYSPEDNPYFYLYGWIDNNWVEIYKTAEGLKSITFKDYVKTNKLLIKNPGGLPVSEVVVKYSTVDNREPDIQIIKPDNNQQFTHQELSREKIIGFVDNPDTEITINGQQAYHRGHYFWLEANRIGAGGNKPGQITAIARDGAGRVNYDSKTIYVGNRPLLEVDLTNEILFTGEDSLRITGTIKYPLNQLSINGEPVNITGQNFSKEVELTTGLNLLKIEGSKADWQGKKEFTWTLYRKIVRLDPLELTVNSPLARYYTNQDSIVISGMVGGLGEFIVKVNGREAVLDGAVFTSQPVELAEGSNIIEIEASNNFDKVIKKITVIKDTTAPVIEGLIPQEGYLSNTASVNVSGRVIDSSNCYVYVNGKASSIFNNEFSNTINLNEGKEVDIEIVAVDQAGNIAELSRTIMVDLSPPEPFMVTADPAEWTNNAQPVISFSTIDIISGISHYEVKIDDGQEYQIESPYKLPALADGEHTITVKAVDFAGWETVATTNVYIDTTPPEAFTPVADPEDWTSNTQPVVTFSTTDAGSGVDHYEVSLDNGDYLVAESPYTLPELTDGIHTINVKAIDGLGFETTGTVSVYIDTIPPVVTLNEDYNGTYTGADQLELTGSIEDLSPVKMTINGEVVELTDNSFSTILPLTEGANGFTVLVTDSAGQITSEEFTIYRDTTPPEAFTPVAEPADWTSNTQPVITFQTTDAVAGLDHYELAINDGDFITVESPYTLPELTDGIHNIKVKAIDKMGLERLGTVKVYIDTTPPEIPANLRVIPGNGKVTVKWDPSSEDTIEYRVKRQPAWEGDGATDYLVVNGTEFHDLDLENGDSYSYQVQAVDRAYNESLPTEWKEATVGLARVDYETEQGNIIEYENVALVLPKEQLPEEIERITITEITSEELEEDIIYPRVGPVYEFSAYKEGSNQPEESMELENGYIGKIEYDESQIPEGFPEQNLDVYYFDTTFGKWFKVPSAGIDVENNQIYFLTNHFSSFSIQATMIQDLTPQEYKDAGYSPLKSYSEHGSITVSPQFGTASTEVTELVLPGRNGFDFVLKRRYDTATARNDAFALALNARIGINIIGPESNVQDYDTIKEIAAAFMGQTGWANMASQNLIKMIEEYLFNQGDFAYSTGQGWRLNIPYIKAANSSLLLRTADGNMHYINEMKLVDVPEYIPNVHRELVFEQHEGADFTLVVEQQYSPVDFTQLVALEISGGDPEENKNAIKSRWYSSGYTLIMKDGTTYSMDALGRTTQMVDPTGLNQIDFHYDGMHLDYIEDSVGRRIHFEYRYDLIWPRIERIWLENDPLEREINYNVGLDNLLHSVQDVAGRNTHYSYDTRLMYGGHAGVTVNIGTIILKLLGAELAGPAVAIFGEDIVLHGHIKAQMVFPMKEMVAPGQGVTRLSYRQPTLMYGSCDVNWFVFIPVSVTLSVNLEQYLLTEGVEVYLDDQKIKTTTYDYSFDYYKWHQPMNYQTVENDGRRETVYKYKPVEKKRYRWEDKSYTVDNGINISFSMQFWTNHALSVLAQMEIRDAASSKLLQSQEYQYNLEKMRPNLIKTIRGNNYTQLNYSYDNWGNVEYSKEFSQAHGRENTIETWSYYLNTDSTKEGTLPWKQSPYAQESINEHIHNLPGGRLVKNYIPDGEGNQEAEYLHTFNRYNSNGQLTDTARWDGTQWAETHFEYYPEDGSLKQMTNPEGHRTFYEYDNYGFPVRITEEDVVDARGYVRDIVTEYGYDYRTGWKQWEKNPRGYVTEYQYDALGRTTKIISPDDDDQTDWTPGGYTPTFRQNNPVTVVEYNDEELYSIITNPEGGQVKYDFDNLGRLVEEIKYSRDEYGNYQEAAVTTLDYDAWGNITAITDPNGNAEGPAWKYTTEYQYDAMGRNKAIIYPDETSISTDNPTRRMDFDYTTNILTITDEKGSRTEEYYDMQDRVIRRVQYLRNEYGNIIDEIETAVYYDGLGNEIITIDPEGNRTVKEYNPLNKVEKVTLPRETFYEEGYQVTDTPYQKYEYNKAGYKIKDIINTPGDGEHVTDYTVDGLGRVIRTTASYTDRNGELKEAVTEIYYDGNGNKIKVVDANNTPLPYAEQKAVTYTYTARDKLLTETDQAGNTTSYTYDKLDNRTSMTDPRGNSGQYEGDFTIIYHYDDLNRLVKGELPASKDDQEKPVVELEYDPRGNLLQRLEPDGGRTSYTYTPRNLVKTETRVGEDKSYTTTYQYDKAGNQTYIIDPEGNETEKRYDDLNRVVRIIYPEGNEEVIEYDKRGNRTGFRDGRGNWTRYQYDSYNNLVQVEDARYNYTEYRYDRLGNLTAKINALNHQTTYDYDELNRLLREEDSLGNLTEYGYDAVGNRIYKKDPNGTESHYQYYPNNLVKEITLTSGEKTHQLTYQYDEAGYQKEVQDGGVVTRYNYLYNPETGSYGYTPDPYGRIYRKTDIVDGKSLSTEYRYDITGRLTGIKTPRGEWVEYSYNTLGELTGIPGYVTETSYNSRGMLEGITAANGINHSYSYDSNGRLEGLSYTNQGIILKSYGYTYDGANNIRSMVKDGYSYTQPQTSSYSYNSLNQLIFAGLEGKFELASDPHKDDQYTGRVLEDYEGQETIREVQNTELIELDYAAGSIGVALGGTYPVTRLELTPDSPVHRVEERNLDVYYSTNNYEYTEVAQGDYELTINEEGQIKIIFTEPVSARYIKIKSYFDDRDENFEPVNKAEFVNEAQDIIKVYYYVSERAENYSYDAVGNRIEETINQRYTTNIDYSYYASSSRLKERVTTDGNNCAYVYDNNGNLIKKGTGYTISGDSVIFALDGEEYWEYEYDLLDRLTSVRKNGITVASYTYNHEGLRIKKENLDTTTYYTFGLNGEVFYEQEDTGYMEYIYVGGQHFARVDGDLLSAETNTYFYHTDHLGSTVLVTNASAEIVWSTEYTPFGSLTMEEGQVEFISAIKFTGKDLDEDTGLYYYNARWYDAEIGRFISADTYKGELENPQTLNLYVYVANNPLIYVDPSGNEYYSVNWGKYTWHPETMSRQFWWKIGHLVPGGKFVNWYIDNITLGDSTISEADMLISTGLDIATLSVKKLIAAPKISYTTYKLAHMGKAVTDANEILNYTEALYNAYKSSSIVQHEQALYEYIKLAGLEDYLTMSAGLTMTGEEVKQTISSRVSFIDDYIAKSKGELDLIDLRKKFEGYYNRKGEFVKGYLQNVEKQKVPTIVREHKVFNDGVYYYECIKKFPKRYLNESNVYSIFYQRWYIPNENLVSSNISYFDKNDKLIEKKHSNKFDISKDDFIE